MSQHQIQLPIEARRESGKPLGFPALVRRAVGPFVLATAFLGHSAFCQTGSGRTLGHPWKGAPGITEDVAHIMARRPALLPGRSAVAPHPLFTHTPPPPATLQAAPNSPAASASAEPLTPQVPGTSFLGAQVSESGFIPPDSMGGVGPSQVLVVVNGRIKVFDRTGNLGPLNTDTDTFFSSVTTAGTSDPRVRYDRLSGRWFISMIDVATVNKVLIAVSSSSNITSTASFTFFQFEHDLVGATPNSDTGQFADYDTLGVDAHALYIGVNIFNSSGTTYLSTTGFVINKADLLNGTLTVTPFRKLALPGGSGPYTPQGVNNDDPNSTEGYFIGVDQSTFAALAIVRVSNPGGTPSVSGPLNVGVGTISPPIGQVHKGDTLNKRLSPVDYRLFTAQINKNQLTGVSSLWTAQNIEVNGSGTPITHGPGGRNGSRWCEIRNLTSTPTLFQSGILFDPASTGPRGFWIPSVAMNGQGHMALGCSYAGANDFAGVAVAGRLASDPVGAIQAPTLAVVSSTAYNLSETANLHRWGDFSIVAVDPNDDMTLWTFQEYCNTANSWGVQAVQLKAPPPATPASTSPASAAQGQSSVNVVVTGTTNSGSGFFDPGPDTGGPGFANHISAAINGGGITVNSVIFSNPTNITLNITVAPGATPGLRTLAVTNPDGQTATSATGIFTVNATPPVASFSAGPTNGPAPLTVLFTNLSTGATNASWNFGNGNVSFVSNPSNTYTNPGTYTVALQVVGPGGTNKLSRTNYINVSVPPPPVAAFTASPTNGATPLTVLFTNLTSGAATSYSWNFGDGNGSTTQNPVHTFTNTGSYTVSLTASGLGGASTNSRPGFIVATNPPPPPVVASFAANPTNGPAPLTVLFTNLSTGATNFHWDFGNGSSSANTNAVEVFTNAGSFTITLTAIGLGGTNVLSRTNYIVVTNLPPPPVVAEFTSDITNGLAPLTVSFTNLSTGATNYSWDFGNGGTSTGTNAVEVFTNAGSYTVTLVAVGLGGTNTLSRTNYLIATNPPPVVADFLASPTNGLAPLAVAFTNLSSAATNYSWTFGDGNTSSATNPVETFTNAGSYTVTLVAVGPGGTNTLSRTNYLVATNPPPVVADFLASPTDGLAPLAVAFTNLSSAATNYSWTFGDGNTSSATNPVETFTNAGSYTVTLVAVGPGGTNTLSRTNYLVATNPPPVVADFLASPTDGLAPLDVAFTNLSTGATNYTWTFGDGNTSSTTNPVEVFTNAGKFTVTLVATGPGGASTLTQTNYITAVVAPLLSPFSSGTNFVFSFPSVINFNYTVLVKDSLTDPAWQAFEVVPGNGSTLFITNSLTSPARRFYRLALP